MKKMRFKLPENIPKELFRKDRLIILLLLGVLLLVIAIPIDSDKETDESGVEWGQTESEEFVNVNENDTIKDYTEYLERQLEEILSLTEGAGSVRVMVTLEDAGEKVVEKDEESTSESVSEEDSAGGTRETTNNKVKEVSIYEGGSSEEGSPYITKEKSPVVAGVVVIAEGGGNAVVVRNITEAIQALFDIDTHKIKVIKGN